MTQPKLNLDFYSGEDSYSDGSIEDEILDIVTHNSDFSRFLATDERWPILYHLSPLRRNLLEWYDFDRNATLLEIGAGCGALTGLFCERTKKVVAVELSRRRAEIVANRHREKANLEIVVGNLNDMFYDRQFDYVTLIGVLEYAGRFTKTDNPYHDFIVQIRKHLKPEGTLIVAIENKFGLKYWAGAKEEHNGGYFESIENYLQNSSIRTFGKAELRALLNMAGYDVVKFYYPMPDYKLPQQIFSDDFLPGIGQICSISPNYDNERIVLFNEATAYDSIIANNQFDFFANSFLLFCRNSGKPPGTVYSAFKRERSPRFQIETSIYRDEGRLRVLKRALRPEAREHVASFHDTYRRLKGHYQNMMVSEAQLRDDGVVFEFAPGDSLDRLLIESVLKRNSSRFFMLLDKFVDSVRDFPLSGIAEPYNTEASRQVFGSVGSICLGDSLAIANIDLRFDNIVLREEGVLEMFDYEWVFDFGVPVNFAIFRNMEAFCQKYAEYMKAFVSFEHLLERYGITEAEAGAYRKMEGAFQGYVMGENSEHMIKNAYKKPVIILRKPRLTRLRDVLGALRSPQLVKQRK